MDTAGKKETGEPADAIINPDAKYADFQMQSLDEGPDDVKRWTDLNSDTEY